jgi:hypothetical protein
MNVYEVSYVFDTAGNCAVMRLLADDVEHAISRARIHVEDEWKDAKITSCRFLVTLDYL